MWRGRPARELSLATRVTRAEQEKWLNIAPVLGGIIVIPYLRRAYELQEEMYR